MRVGWKREGRKGGERVKKLRGIVLEGVEEGGDEDLDVLVEDSSRDLRVDGSGAGLGVLRPKR